MLQLLQTWRTSYTAPSKMVIGRTVKMIRVRIERHLLVGDFMQRFGWGWGLALATVLAAIVAAGCFIYLIRAPLRVEATHRSPPHPPNPVIQNKEAPAAVSRLKNDEARAIAAFQQAADAILSRAPNLSASAVVAERPIAGKIPLPRRRPAASP
jgi:hypothetical protein